MELYGSHRTYRSGELEDQWKEWSLELEGGGSKFAIEGTTRIILTEQEN